MLIVCLLLTKTDENCQYWPLLIIAFQYRSINSKLVHRTKVNTAFTFYLSILKNTKGNKLEEIFKYLDNKLKSIFVKECVTS